MTLRIINGDPFEILLPDALASQGPGGIRADFTSLSPTPPAPPSPSPVPESLVFVAALPDLPDAVDGVIALVAGRTYFFTAEVDLLGARLSLGDSTVLRGTSSENAIITSTGLDAGTPLITAEHGGPVPMQDLRIQGVGTALYIDGMGGANAALDWRAVNFVNVPTIGIVKNIANFIVNDSAYINSAGLTFDGTVATISFFQTLWSVPAGLTAITLPNTLVVSRRFRWTYSPMLVPATSTGFAFANIATTIPTPESFGIIFANLSGGGNYLAGASYIDTQVAIVSTIGVTNSSPTAHFYMNNNAVSTAIGMAGTYTKVLGSTSAGAYVTKFTTSDNRATYVGGPQRFFALSAFAAFTSGNANKISIRFAVNGVTLSDTTQSATANSSGRIESCGTLGTVALTTGQYVEVFVTNESGTTAVTVTDLQVRISAVAG